MVGKTPFYAVEDTPTHMDRDSWNIYKEKIDININKKKTGEISQ